MGVGAERPTGRGLGAGWAASLPGAHLLAGGGSEVVTPAFSQTTAQPRVSSHPGLCAPVQLCRPSRPTACRHLQSWLCKFLGTCDCTHVP